VAVKITWYITVLFSVKCQDMDKTSIYSVVQFDSMSEHLILLLTSSVLMTDSAHIRLCFSLYVLAYSLAWTRAAVPWFTQITSLMCLVVNLFTPTWLSWLSAHKSGIADVTLANVTPTESLSAFCRQLKMHLFQSHFSDISWPLTDLPGH